ncbi:hypothetical protein [Tenacibaculum sp. M341]|uniref:hypothetical protein n=1 Tax=Tenacibaculum sp. M341 TaxID=2530339 RepID=UPI0010488C5D|nr:hypothetical protein [Tenacibaculum sp. M341]TCI90175.1 hypothetical protein EYW44_14680 [Tenacibaculum sp. M341]
MKKTKWFLLLLILVINGCEKKSSLSEIVLKRAILSNEFNNYFKISKRRSKILYVYNNVNNTTFTVKNTYNQEIKFKKVDFEFNITSSSERQYKGVLLYKYTVEKGDVELGFVDLQSNANLRLKFDDNFNLIETRRGVF